MCAKRANWIKIRQENFFSRPLCKAFPDCNGSCGVSCGHIQLFAQSSLPLIHHGLAESRTQASMLIHNGPIWVLKSAVGSNTEKIQDRH